eukprot:scaffold3885_cov99-Amphora_coffeaeformis.AAC.1
MKNGQSKERERPHTSKQEICTIHPEDVHDVAMKKGRHGQCNPHFHGKWSKRTIYWHFIDNLFDDASTKGNNCQAAVAGALVLYLTTS